MSISRHLFLLIVLLAGPFPARAWDPPGHQIVAELADRQLRPAAHAEVARLLAAEGSPNLSAISNWAGDVRDRGSEQIGTAAWHYINFKGGDCSYVPVRDCPDGNCVIAAINRNFLVLSDRSRSDDERRTALKFLVHFVGDVHQPLHSTPLDDKGGNTYQVSYEGKGQNLHHVWDALIVEKGAGASANYADVLEKQPPLPDDPTRHSDRPAVDWAVESCRLVLDGEIYPPGHVIDDAYLMSHLPLAELRLRQAGQRLADMLNFALAPLAKQ
jgi:hypothetical protein